MPMMTEDGIKNLMARADMIFEGDHRRGCQGREYSCDCGYDEKKDELLADLISLARTLLPWNRPRTEPSPEPTP